MGMTDRQFDLYLKALLKNLEKALEEVKMSGKSDFLESIIQDLKDELCRP